MYISYFRQLVSKNVTVSFPYIAVKNIVLYVYNAHLICIFFMNNKRIAQTCVIFFFLYSDLKKNITP